MTVLNTAPHAIDLAGWALLDTQKKSLALNGTLDAGAVRTVTVADPFALSNKGGVITLVDEKGLKVDGVSYTKTQAKQPGWTIVFCTIEVRSEGRLRYGARGGTGSWRTALRYGAGARGPECKARRVGVTARRGRGVERGAADARSGELRGNFTQWRGAPPPRLGPRRSAARVSAYARSVGSCRRPGPADRARSAGGFTGRGPRLPSMARGPRRCSAGSILRS